jgi:hypothetical protein
LGTEWDSESDGTHSVQSDFDDLNPGASPDDEDGVTFGALNPGDPAAVTDVTVSGAPTNGAFLDAWVDFNQDNDWNDPGEQIFSSQVVVNGVNNLTFSIPAGALPGTTYTRYRLSAGGGLTPDGAASTGEVEDYEVRIAEAPVNASDIHFWVEKEDGNSVVYFQTVEGVSLTSIKLYFDDSFSHDTTLQYTEGTVINPLGSNAWSAVPNASENSIFLYGTTAQSITSPSSAVKFYVAAGDINLIQVSDVSDGNAQTINLEDVSLTNPGAGTS